MESFQRQVLDKVPLAEAAHRVLAFALEPAFLEDLFKENRGSSYTKVISFSVMTHLIGDALFQNKSGRCVFEQGKAEGTLPATVEAAYKKLRRVPVPVSMALLEGCSQRIQSVLPACGERTMPASLAQFTGIVMDGKVSKGVQRRLKGLRQAKGGLIGGRSLVAYHMNQGTVLGFHGDEDGDANDVRFLPHLTPKIRQRVPGRRLWIADRQFAFLKPLAELAKEGDDFLVRYSKAVAFTRDQTQPLRHGQDKEKRAYTEEWGWLGTKDKDRRWVRRISVERGPSEAVILLTSLHDADQYAAVDLLEIYRQRTDIEYVFERITEVFSVRRLIGSSPRATLFQLSLCLLLYNVLQLLRGYLAHGNGKEMDEVSPKKLLESVRQQMTACQLMLGKAKIIQLLGEPMTAEQLREYLAERLHLWDKRWAKAPRYKNRPPKPKTKSGHACAHRILTKAEGSNG